MDREDVERTLAPPPRGDQPRSMSGPLDGVVVALEQAVAAPFATRQLADSGARAIKIVRVGDGDWLGRTATAARKQVAE